MSGAPPPPPAAPDPAGAVGALDAARGFLAAFDEAPWAARLGAMLASVRHSPAPAGRCPTVRMRCAHGMGNDVQCNAREPLPHLKPFPLSSGELV